MSGLTQQLARFVAQPGFDAASSEAFAIAKTGIADTTATLFAGCCEPVVGLLLKHYAGLAGVSGAGAAPVPFAKLSLPSAQAACVNGTAAHALDYDDVALSGHPSTVITPAILAEGHVLGASGAEVLRAYVVGYEVWAELFSRESGQYHLKGWHPTGVFGTIAAAAAVAHLHKLPAELCARALSLSASMASGLVSNFGTMTKPLHAGRAAAAGIEAVQLAKLGLTAAPDVFEHRAGFLHAISLEGKVDLQTPATHLGKRLRILDSGLSIKRYPMCYSAHRSIDAVLDIVTRENLQADQVRKVSESIGRAQSSMLRNHRPETGLEAKFSLEFAVAAALTERRVGLAELTDGFVARPKVREQFEQVAITTADTQCPLDPAFAYADQVVIETNDGRWFDSGEVRFARGHAKLPLSLAQLREKFVDCIAIGSSTSGIDQAAGVALYERFAGLERQGNVRNLF